MYAIRSYYALLRELLALMRRRSRDIDAAAAALDQRLQPPSEAG